MIHRQLGEFLWPEKLSRRLAERVWERVKFKLGVPMRAVSLTKRKKRKGEGISQQTKARKPNVRDLESSEPGEKCN